MENENKKPQLPKKLKENKYNVNPPVEFVESDDARPKTTPDIKDRHDDIKKFKSGDVGAEQFRLNDDGTPYDDSAN